MFSIQLQPDSVFIRVARDEIERLKLRIAVNNSLTAHKLQIINVLQFNR